MKLSTKNQAQGVFHKALGKIKEITGTVSLNSELEGKGKNEARAGTVQQKVGEVEKVVGK